MAANDRPPLSPPEAWRSDGRHVLHFRPTRSERWERWVQELEVVSGSTVGLAMVDAAQAFANRRTLGPCDAQVHRRRKERAPRC